MLLCCHVVMLQCCHGTMLSWYHVVILSCIHAIMLSCLACYHVTMLPCCHAIILSCNHVFMVNCHVTSCRVTMLSCHNVVMLPIIILLQLKEEKLLLLWGLVTIDQTLVLIQFVTGEQKYHKNNNICNYLKINDKNNDNDNT